MPVARLQCSEPGKSQPRRDLPEFGSSSRWDPFSSFGAEWRAVEKSLSLDGDWQSIAAIPEPPRPTRTPKRVTFSYVEPGSSLSEIA